MRTARVIACVVAMMSLWSAGAVSAVSPSAASATIIADLEGRPLKPALISSHYCHDFAFPRIHCFRTAALLEVSKVQAAGLDAPAAGFGPSDYVTIFDGVSYTGAYMDVSQNYDALFSIGWNDRVSSYKGRNNASGKFWTDWFASGTSRAFCCNTLVPNLPAGLDNAFSSVYRL